MKSSGYIIWSEDRGFLIHTFATNRKAAWEKMMVTKRLARQLGWRCISVRLVPISPGIPGYQPPM
jgi:hypothetical protein